MLSYFDEKGNLRPITNCNPGAPHWDIYRRARREQPQLVQHMYDTIAEIISSGRYVEPNGKFPNSTWLGHEILRDWEYKNDWNTFCGNAESISSALFGEIMFVVMCEHEDQWITCITCNANADREERVYWRP